MFHSLFYLVEYAIVISLPVLLSPSISPSPAAKQVEERNLHEAKLAKMEAEMKMVFQQKVQEKEAKLKQSEEELYARHREMKEALEKQRLELEDKKRRVEQGRPLTPEKSSVSGFCSFLAFFLCLPFLLCFLLFSFHAFCVELRMSGLTISFCASFWIFISFACPRAPPVADEQEAVRPGQMRGEAVLANSGRARVSREDGLRV